LTGDQREQVAGSAVWIDEARPVAPVRQVAFAVGVASGDLPLFG